MANPTAEDIDLSQLDLADAETRKYVEGQIDLNDPETKKWWDSAAGPSAPKNNVVNDLQMGADAITQAEADPGLSDEDAATYLVMTRDPRVSGQQLGEWLGQRGKVFNEQSQKELDVYRKALAEGIPTTDAVSYRSIVPEVLPEQRLTPDQDVGGLGASLEQGMALNPMGVVSRLVQDWTDADLGEGLTKDELRQRYPNLSDDGIEALHDSMIGELRRREVANANYQVEDTGANLGQRIVGNIVGSASPVDLIPLGKGASVGRIAAEAGVQNALADAVVQAGDVAYGAQDQYNFGQTAQAGGEGVALGGVLGGLGKLAGPVAEAPVAPVEREAWPKRAKEQMDRAKTSVEQLTSNWGNKPSIAVEPNFKKFPDLDQNAIAAVTENGDIAINMKNVVAEAKALGVHPEDVLSAATFHESLGHYGVAEKFGDDLDLMLNEFYNNSKGDFKSKVDKWIDENPDAYIDDPDPLARAAEEVLAEMSESGKIDRSILDRVKDYIKNLGRDIGVDWSYSDREIRSILSMAHDSVVKGTDSGTGALGVRYMKRRTAGSGSEGMAQGPRTQEVRPENPDAIGKYRSTRNIEPILGEAAPERTKETWSDWIDEAGKIKMTSKAAGTLDMGDNSPALLAAKEFAVRKANRISDLMNKARDQTLSPREQFTLEKDINDLQTVEQSISDFVANAARILNSTKIEVGSDKALTDSVRNMVRKLKPEDLDTPEKVTAVANKLVKDSKKAKLIEGSLRALGNALNFPRTIMSSMDLSAPFRQGLFLVNRKEFWKALPNMMKQAVSERKFDQMNAEYQSRPTYRLMERSGLALSDLGGNLSKREEAFMSQWAEQMPVIGKLVRGSERAYTGFLNQVRADTFDSLVKQSEEAGIDLKKDPKALKDIASFINAATGRGSLGKFNGSVPLLSAIFFSPRLMASRLTLLNPAYYARLSPVVRKEAVKSLLSLGGIALTLTSLAKMAGADVESDPRSSDFGKIRTGDTRYDILGGFGQYITLGARLVSNETKNAKGQVKQLGKGYGDDTRLDVAGKFLTNKESPIASFVTDYLRGSNAIGEPFETRKAIAERFVPMFAKDAAEMMQKYGAGEGAAKVAPSMIGIGVQDYKIEGYDTLGRAYNDKPSNEEPVAKEVNRLTEVNGKDILNPVRKSLTIDGKDITLDDEIYYEYQKLAGEYISSDLKEEMASEEWASLPDDDKIAIIKQIARDARADARADLFRDFNVSDEEGKPE